MAQTSILREYLVRLGWQLDEHGERKVDEALTKTAKRLANLAKIATESFAAAGIAVAGLSKKLEDLSFSADKAGTSARNLFAVGKAAEQIGVGADTASAAIQQLASNIRQADPLATRFFRILGFNPSGDQTQNLFKLLEAFKNVPEGSRLYRFTSQKISDLTGLSEPDIHLLETHLTEFESFYAQQNRMAKNAGVNINTLAAQSHDFMQRLRNLGTQGELFGMKALEGAQPAAKTTVDYLSDMADTLHSIDSKTGGWLSLFGGVLGTAGAGAAGGYFLRRILGGGATAAGEAATGAGAALAAGGAAATGLAGLDVALGIHDFGKAKQLFQSYKQSGVFDSIADFVKKWEGPAGKLYRDTAGKLTIGYGHAVAAGENFSGGLSDSQQEGLLAQDLNPAVAAVLRLVKVSLNKNQLTALSDFVYNVGAGAFAKSTLLKFLNAGDFSEAANQFTAWSKIHHNGMVVDSQGLMNRRLGERALFLQPAVNQTVSQKNETHIHGVSDPERAVSLVERQRKKQDRMLIRNLADGAAF